MRYIIFVPEYVFNSCVDIFKTKLAPSSLRQDSNYHAIAGLSVHPFASEHFNQPSSLQSFLLPPSLPPLPPSFPPPGCTCSGLFVDIVPLTYNSRNDDHLTVFVGVSCHVSVLRHGYMNTNSLCYVCNMMSTFFSQQSLLAYIVNTNMSIIIYSDNEIG